MISCNLSINACFIAVINENERVSLLKSAQAFSRCGHDSREFSDNDEFRSPVSDFHFIRSLNSGSCKIHNVVKSVMSTYRT